MASLLASWSALVYHEKATRPLLEIVEDPTPALGQAPGQPAHGFYHVIVQHKPPWWPFACRRPAWSCTASIEVWSPNGTQGGPDAIPARWPSQPEPVKTILRNGQPETILDPTLIYIGRKADVHFDESRRGAVKLDVALKFEGDDTCCLFSNESYMHAQWVKPEWALPAGRHRLKLCVRYEIGEAVAVFDLVNETTARGGLRIVKVDA